MANNSQIGSSSHDPLKRSYSQIGLEVALAILISLMSFLGNLLVVYVVHKDSRPQELDEYIHPKPGIDWHCYGNATHALLGNKSVYRDLDF